MNSKLKTFSLNAINAASKIDLDIHVLVAGNKCENVCKEVAAVPLVKKVLQSESINYQNKIHPNIVCHEIKLPPIFLPSQSRTVTPKIIHHEIELPPKHPPPAF